MASEPLSAIIKAPRAEVPLNEDIHIRAPEISTVKSNGSVDSVSAEEVCHINGLAYITGAVIRKVLKKEQACSTCKSFSVTSETTSWATSFTRLKSRGGLTIPSSKLLEISEAAESVLQRNWEEIEKLKKPLVIADKIHSLLSDNDTLELPSCGHDFIYNYLKLFVPLRFKVHSRKYKARKRSFASKVANPEL